MLTPTVVFPPLDGDTGETTRILFVPDGDIFVIQQGSLVSADPDCPVEAAISLTPPQLVQLYEILQHEGFNDAIAMALHDYNRTKLH